MKEFLKLYMKIYREIDCKVEEIVPGIYYRTFVVMAMESSKRGTYKQSCYLPREQKSE